MTKTEKEKVEQEFQEAKKLMHEKMEQVRILIKQS
jgi:hypothetical protein